MTDRLRKHGYTVPADTRLAAWEIMTGEKDLSAARHCRAKPHRGTLPDVDLGAAVRDLERRALLRRIVQLVWGRRRSAEPGPEADPLVSGSSAARVGKGPSPSYIRLAETSDDRLAAPEGTEMPSSRAA